MEIVDLSIAFSEGMPKFPADWFPEFAVDEVDHAAGRASRRFTAVTMTAHIGTHVESSDHVLRDDATIDTVPLDAFAGYPAIVDLREVRDGAEVPLELIRERAGVEDGPAGRIVLLMTGYDDRRWGKAGFWERSPWLSLEAAEYLAAAEPSLIGLDFQPERPQERDFRVHRSLVSRGAVLCEYLFNLERMDRQTLFLALPIKIDGVEAAPVRAVGIKGLNGSR